MVNKLLPYLFLLCACLAHRQFCAAQTGTFTATFTPAGGGKAITMHVATQLYKYNNPHGYWFTNPHDGSRHFNIQPDAGYGSADAAFITLNNAENDFEFFDGGSSDSNQVSLHTGEYFIEPPEWNVQDKPNNKPIHIHYNIFTASEISFTITGTARYGTQKGNGSWIGLGTIQATGHFYREPQYAKSDVLPGCDCDPTIYGYLYDPEDGIRTASGCENALANKVFDAVQKALSPLFTKLNYQGPASDAAGSTDITVLAGHANIAGPPKTRPYCMDNYSHNWIVPFNFEKNIFTNDDSYGLRFIKIPSKQGADADGMDAMKKQAALIDSVMRLYAAQKITLDDFQKFAKSIENSPAYDIKKAEVDHNLYLTVFINPVNSELLFKVADKSRAVIQHNIKESAFEIYSPAVKDDDGDWVSNKMYIYLGQYTAPTDGKSDGDYNAKLVKPTYRPGGNKLTIYNILVRLEGAQDLIDKAAANIDYTAIIQLISKQ